VSQALARALAAASLLFAVACGGKSPQAPTPFPTPPPSVPTWTLPGRLVTTLSGAPVAHATVYAFIATAESAADGTFTLSATPGPSGSQAVTVTAEGYRPRETVIKWPRTNDLVIDVMSTAKPFDETFYGQLAHGTLDYPGQSYGLLRWSSPMRFYVTTHDEFGRPLERSVIDLIERGIHIGVQYYTAGNFQADIVEGSETRPEQTGWVNVVPRRVISGGEYCGLSSSVGGDPNTIQLLIDGCGCGSTRIPIAVVIHEVGHAVGMFHVSGKENVMHTPADLGCREVIPTAAEQYHAALIYSRPRGNMSPDRDTGTFELGQRNDGPERTPPLP
jgi:carboxypeptidase family protein